MGFTSFLSFAVLSLKPVTSIPFLSAMVFDVGRDPLRRVPMMEPLRGTAGHVAKLIDESNTAAELVERLGA